MSPPFPEIVAIFYYFAESDKYIQNIRKQILKKCFSFVCSFVL